VGLALEFRFARLTSAFGCMRVTAFGGSACRLLPSQRSAIAVRESVAAFRATVRALLPIKPADAQCVYP